MDQTTRLVEQHIRASESHLRHIDELMQRASTAGAGRSVPPDAQAQLARFQRDRAKLGQELDEVKSQSLSDAHTAVKRGEGLTDMLGTLGAEMEKALLAIFERDHK